MSSVRRSRLEILSILDHVDLWGADATSEKFKVDRRTLARWAEREPSGWQREEEVNRLLMIEKRAAGKVSYRDAIVGAGIATDKLWRAADRAARALRLKGEATCDCILPPGWVPELHPKAGTPEHAAAVWAIAAANMDEPRRHFMHALRPLLAFFIDNENGETRLDIPEASEATAAALAGMPKDLADHVAAIQQWIENLDDETLAARQALVDAAYDAYREALQGELQRRAYDEATAAAEYDASRASPSQPEPTESPEPAPTPIRRVSRPPAPSPMVVDVRSDPDHDRGWEPLWREDF